MDGQLHWNHADRSKWHLPLQSENAWLQTAAQSCGLHASQHQLSECQQYPSVMEPTKSPKGVSHCRVPSGQSSMKRLAAPNSRVASAAVIGCCSRLRSTAISSASTFTSYVAFPVAGS